MARKLTKLEKFGLIAAVITGMIFAYLKHVYDPQQAALQQAHEQLNRSIREFNRLQAAEPVFQLRQQLASRKEELQKVKEELESLNVPFGSAEDRIRSQHWVSRQMESRGLRVVQVAPRGLQQDELFQWHAYRFTVEGDFRGLIGFLRDLSPHAASMQVKEVSVNGDGNTWPLLVSIDLWILG